MCVKIKENFCFFGIKCKKPYCIHYSIPELFYSKKIIRTDFYTFCFCVTDYIKIEIDNKLQYIYKNELLILSPFSTIRLLEYDKNVEMKFFFLDKSFLIENRNAPFFIEKIGLLGVQNYQIIPLTDNSIEQLTKIFNHLKIKINQKGKFIENIIYTIIFNILLEIAELNYKKEKCENKSIIVFYTFKELVQKYIMEHRDINYYANNLCISNKYLIKIVKKASGKTPSQIINETLLKEAYMLMNNTQDTLSVIAYKLNFSSLSAFGRFFKRYSSISPSEYRKKDNFYK